MNFFEKIIDWSEDKVNSIGGKLDNFFNDDKTEYEKQLDKTKKNVISFYNNNRTLVNGGIFITILLLAGKIFLRPTVIIVHK